MIAQDFGDPPLHSIMNVLVTVKDVNDNVPKFPQELYELYLPENLTRGKELLKIRAIDIDVDQKLIYRIDYMTRNLFALISLGDQVFFYKNKIFLLLYLGRNFKLNK